MAINKNKVQLQETVLDSNGHPLSSTDVNPLTSSDCVIMENGMTLEDVMGNDTVIDTPTIMNEDTSFKVGIGDSETKVIDSDVAKMVIEGKTYQNILPKPTTLIMNTDEKEFKINDKIDSSIVLDDNVAEIATVKGQTYVNVVQEESASEYVAIDEELNGQSITTTGKPEGYVKNATLEGLTLVNTIQEPSGADATVLELDADIDAQYATIDNTVQGGIHGAKLNGMTLVNLGIVKSKYISNTWGYVTFDTKLIKPSTKYYYKLFNLEDGLQHVVTNGNGSEFYNSYSSNKWSTFTTSTTEPTSFEYFTIHIKTSPTEEQVNNIQLLILEYQEGMENWDIPYFEGMQSVEVPSVKTTGKNLFDENNVTVNPDYITIDNIKNTMKNGNINFYISRDEYWIGTFSYNNGILTMSPTSPYKGAWIMIGNLKPNSKATISYTFNGEGSIGGASNSTATVDNDGYCKFVIENREAVEYSISKIQIEYGESSSAYEPYKSSVFTISETNLIIDSEKGRYYHYESGYMATDGGSRYDSYRANVEGLMSVYVKNTHSNYTFWDANMNFISGVPYVNGLISDGSHNKDGVVNVPSNAKYMRFAYDTVENNGLPCVSKVIALRKVGDVQDELDLETGKLTQRIGEIVLDGSEGWWDNTEYVTDTLIEFGYNIGASIKGDNTIICDKFQPTDVNGVERIYMLQIGNVYIRILKTKVTTVDEFKAWLASNPITVQYQLETPITRQVDLSILDQDNNPVKTIQTHPTMTHVSTSSQGLIPNVVIPSQLKYPTIIKPSTTYTVQLKQTTVNSEFPLAINLGGATMAVPSTKFTITTPSELTSQDVIFTGKNNVIGEVVITEGDTTDIEYGFFEGMNDVKSPKLFTTGKNLLHVGYGTNTASYGGITVNFDANAQTFTVNGTSEYNNICFSISKFSKTMIKGKRYVLSMYLVSGTSDTISFRINDANWGYTLGNTLGSAETSKQASLTFEKTVKYIDASIRIDSGKTFNNAVFKVMLEEVASGNATPYEPYKGVTIEQDIDSIPLTSDMFEQGRFNDYNFIKGMSLQQLTKGDSTTRIRSNKLIPVKPNTKYIVNIPSGSLLGSGVAYSLDKNGGYNGRLNSFTSFTTKNDTYFVIGMLGNTDSSDISPSTLDSLNLTLQEVTDEIVLRSIGDVKDTLNLTTGEYVQRIGEVVFDGSEEIVWGVISDGGKLVKTICFTVHEYIEGAIMNSAICSHFQQIYSREDIEHFYNENLNGSQALVFFINRDKLTTLDHNGFNQWLSQNPLTIQYILETPIIKKVNLTNTTKLPSYTSTTHYDTIVPSNSLIPNIKLPSTIDYNVAIKPSTQYTIRANTTSAMSVDLGGSTGTLANGKVTLTTPSTLAHNSLKLGNGKAKEVMVIEGSEIKDNVPFFNGMKNVQMGGIKLVNIARFKNVTALVTANDNKTQFTYTGDGSGWGYVIFHNTLLKPNTKYTIYMNAITITGDNSYPIKITYGHNTKEYTDIAQTGIFKKAITTLSEENGFDKTVFSIAFRPCSSGGQVVIQNPMIIEGDWTHLDEIPFIESEMIIEQPIIRSQGKNLFDIKEDGTVWGGASIKSNSDNTITFSPNSDNGAALSCHLYFKQPIKVKTGTKYTYSMKRISGGNADFSGSINNQILVRKKDGTIANAIGMSDFNTNTFNQTLTATYIFDDTVESIIGVTPIMYAVGNLTSPVIMQFQIEEGSTATTYEPFKQHTLSSNRVIGYEDGCYYDAANSGVKTTQNSINSMLADVEGLPIAYVTGGSSNYTFWDKDNVFISGKLFLDTSLSSFDKNGFIAVPSNAKYMRFAAGGETNAQPLYKVATVTGDLPLRSLPNGVCDSFNLVTGEYVQRVGEVVLDGINIKPKWIVQSVTNNITSYFDFERVFTGAKTKSYAFSDKFVYENYLYNDDRTRYTEGIRIGDEGWGSIRIFNSRLETADYSGFVKWLSQNPITVQYELETPIVRKIGLTAKGVFTEASLGDYDWEASPTSSPSTTRYRTTSAKSLPIVYNTHLFTEDFDVRHFNIDSHGDYEYVSNMEYGQYVNVRRERLESDTLEAFKKWLTQNPIKVGYITWKQTSSSYSNIQKPIFFNNVNVQFMNNNVDIQPTLTLQARSMNSYVMDMMKANTVYTSKFWHNGYDTVRTRIDNTYMDMSKNGTFTSPSTLGNKLLITATGVQEFMIIEGDVTGKNLPYFKGIRSSFDNTDEIEVFVKNKNLIDIKKANKIADIDCSFTNNGDGSVTLTGTGDGNGEGIIVTDYYFHIKEGKSYTFSFESDGQIGGANGTDTVEMFLLKDGQTKAYVNVTTNKKTFMTYEGDYCLRFDINKNNTTHRFWNIQLIEQGADEIYQPHKENSTIINMPMQLDTVEVVKPVSEDGALEQSNGSNCISANNSEQRFDYIPVQPNDWILIYNNSNYRPMKCCLYDINKNFIKYVFTNGQGLTIPRDCYFIRGYSVKTDTSNLNIVIQREAPIALNELSNGVKDELIINRATSSAKLIRRVGKVVLDGFSDGHDETVAEFNFRKFVIYTGLTSIKVAGQCVTSNNLPCIVNGEVRNTIRLAVDGKIVINIDGFSSINEYFNYLKQNPLTVYYELAEPSITEIRLKGYPFVYEDGSITLNTDIAPVTRTSYNVNQHQLINSQNETIIRHDKQISDLYDYIEIYLDEIYHMELFKMQLELSL